MSSKNAPVRRSAGRAVPRRPDTSRNSRRLLRRPSLAEGWRHLSWSQRVLRAFLGVTFLFAGAQKLFDPSFLHAGSPGYIGAQLKAFARGSPVGPILLFLARAPVVSGLAVAMLEIAIGVGTLLGVATTTAAFAGLAVSLTLWLSATWHVHPYFLGSDSIYAVAWLSLLAGRLEVERARTGHVPGPIQVIDQMERREVLRGGVVAGLTLTVAAVSRAFAGPSPAAAAGFRTRRRAGAGPAGSAMGPPVDGPSASASVPGRTITTLDRLPVGKAIGFMAPGIGAAVLVRLATDNVVAYSRICTHAGCLVGYDPTSRILVCPCHGAEFDPARGAAVIAGPAPTPLPTIDVVVDPRTRKVILPA